MKNNITTLIESGYANLRKSEKQAADYILEHLEQIPDLPIDRLAKEAQAGRGACQVGEALGRRRTAPADVRLYAG